jgi:hypothetical protein
MLVAPGTVTALRRSYRICFFPIPILGRCHFGSFAISVLFPSWLGSACIFAASGILLSEVAARQLRSIRPGTLW